MASGFTNSSEGLAQQKTLLADLLLQSGQTEVYPASLAQKRLWFLHELEPDTSAYNVDLGLWLQGPLDIDSLRSSLQELMNRHASLRTGFRLEAGNLLQVVTRGLVVNLHMSAVSGEPPESYAAAYRLAQVEIERPFDLSQASLFRGCLIRVTTGNDHVLLCTMPHIVTDSWSMQIMARELSTLYTAFTAQQPSSLPELAISYGDYSEWQNEWFKTAKVQQQLTFWKDELEDAPPVLELRMQRPRSDEQTFNGSSQTVPISDDILAGIKSLAVQLQATPFMLFLAAFKILLYRASGQADLLVGVPVAGRNMVETEGLVGFFVNTLVLRDDLFFNPPFEELVAQVRETTLNAFANADVPFEKVVEVLQPERNLSYNPIFQVMFSVIKSAVRSHAFGDLIAFPYVVTPSTSIFDLSMTIIEGVDGDWFAQIDHNTDLFLSQDISRLLSGYTQLLQAIIDNPQERIGDFQVADIAAAEGHAGSASGVCETEISSRTALRSRQKRKAPPAREPKPARPDERLEADEQLLVDIWKNLLRLPNLGIDDSFFDVGGHSLLAAQLIALVQSATGRKIAVSAIFRAPTIREFARLLRQNALSQPDPIILKMGGGRETVPLFAVAEPGVDTFGFAQLARHLPPGQSLFKVQAPSPIVFGRPRTLEELQALGRQYVGAIRSEQPRGPYCLAAMCEGVPITQQMILQLEADGEEVELFAIFDTWVLENSQIRPLWAIDYYLQRFREFQSLSVAERWENVRRVFRRLTSRNNDNDNVNPGRGWRRAYWPSEDFQPPRFRAPVLLFKRPRQPFFYIRDPQMGWGARSTGGVTICEVKCGHVEMLRDPHVRLVGKTLGKRLQAIAEKEGMPLTVPALLAHLRTESDSGTAGSTA
jgi:thioesterase domain-containing protein